MRIKSRRKTMGKPKSTISFGFTFFRSRLSELRWTHWIGCWNLNTFRGDAISLGPKTEHSFFALPFYGAPKRRAHSFHLLLWLNCTLNCRLPCESVGRDGILLLETYFQAWLHFVAQPSRAKQRCRRGHVIVFLYFTTSKWQWQLLFNAHDDTPQDKWWHFICT